MNTGNKIRKKIFSSVPSHKLTSACLCSTFQVVGETSGTSNLASSTECDLSSSYAWITDGTNKSDAVTDNPLSSMELQEFWHKAAWQWFLKTNVCIICMNIIQVIINGSLLIRSDRHNCQTIVIITTAGSPWSLYASNQTMAPLRMQGSSKTRQDPYLSRLFYQK